MIYNVTEDFFLANSAEPDKMSPMMYFIRDLSVDKKHPFVGITNQNGL